VTDAVREPHTPFTPEGKNPPTEAPRDTVVTRAATESAESRDERNSADRVMTTES
jgi:hypothetical protein